MKSHRILAAIIHCDLSMSKTIHRVYCNATVSQQYHLHESCYCKLCLMLFFRKTKHRLQQPFKRLFCISRLRKPLLSRPLIHVSCVRKPLIPVSCVRRSSFLSSLHRRIAEHCFSYWSYTMQLNLHSSQFSWLCSPSSSDINVLSQPLMCQPGT